MKYIFLSIILLLTACSGNGQQNTTQYKIKTVVIDAGHGGKDPGALGRNSQEKDIALAIALKLGNYIEKNVDGVKVIYTRKTDKFVELFERANIANRNKADLFISIHVNSTKKGYSTGTSTYVMGLHKTDDNLEVAKTENSVIFKEQNYEKNYKGFDPDSPETYIILNLYQNAYLEQSLLFADLIQKQFRTRAGRVDKGVKQAGLIVLWQTTMPSVLVETGFINNPQEEKFLMSDYGQSIIASAIYRAFKEYKQLVENNQVHSFTTGNQKENFSDIQNNNNNNKNDKIVFKVQIKTSDKKISLNSKNFKGLKNVSYFYHNGLYKYTYGETADYDKAIELQRIARKKYPDAFVIAFKNNKRITIKQALKEVK